MKKILLTVIALFSFFLTSCGLELHGLKEYNPNNSSVSLSKKLLPNEQFVDLFEYENGDYFYFDSGLELFPEHALERELLYLQYSEQAYINAKEYTINNIDISKKNHFSYNGYEFFENIEYANYNEIVDNDGENKYFPQEFNMYAYNDEKRTLVFLGFYVYKPSTKDTELLKFDNIGDFLKEYFSFYNFTS